MGSNKIARYPFEEPDKKAFINPWNNKILMRFLSDLESWHKYIRFLGMPTTQEHKDVLAEKLFVSPRFADRYIKPSEKEPDKEQELFDLNRLLKKHPRAFILGDPGSGKSTLVDWITTRFCKQTGETEIFGPLIPLPMVLREMKLGDVETFEDLIDVFLEHDKCAAFKENKEFLNELLKNGQAVLLLDGLDEVANPNTRKKLARALRNGFEGVKEYQHVRCLFTTRLIGFDQSAFYYGKEQLKGKGFRGKENDPSFWSQKWKGGKFEVEWLDANEKVLPEIYLAPFINSQIGEFAHKWYRHAENNKIQARKDAEELKIAVHANPNVLSLSRTPNLLTLIALLHRISAILPADRHKLYEELTDAYLVKIEQTKRRKETSYRLEEHHQWLAVLGWEFQQKRGKEVEGVMMAFNKIQNILLKAMQETPGYEESTKEDVEQYLEYVCRRSGVLVPRSEDQYAFTHLSFQEYYAAQYLKLLLQKAQSEASFGENPRILREFNEQLADFFHQEFWWETLYLFFKSFEADRSTLPHLLKRAFEKSDVPGFVYIYYSDFKSYLKPDLEQKIKHERKLKLNYPQLQKLDFVELCDKLVELDLTETSVSDLSSLSGLSSLKELYLNSTGISDLSPVSGLLKLEVLDFSRTSVSNVSPLSSLSKLEVLKFNQTSVSDLEPIANCVDLAVLEFSKTPVSDLTALSRIQGLGVLKFDETNVSDISPLTGLGSLWRLYLKQTSVSDVSPLSGLERLGVLDISNTDVSNLSPLLHLKRLRELYLNSTTVYDLSPIAGLKMLRNLSIKHTDVSDVSPLSGLENLLELHVKQTGISDFSQVPSRVKIIR